MMLDPANVSFIQNYCMERINDQYQLMIHYASYLLYIFAVLELTFFGLLWALQQYSSWEKLFLKGFKICFIFFIVNHFPYFCQLIIQSFAQIGYHIGAAKTLNTIIFNPSLLWQYGYNPAMTLLKTAAVSSGIGLPLLQITLGLMIVLIFALFMIHMIVYILGFYFITLTALLVLPIGVFAASVDIFPHAMTHILKAGVRVMIMISVTGIAVNIWNLYDLSNISDMSHLNQVLGLLISGLLFLYLIRYLPKLAANVIGRIYIPLPIVSNNTSPVLATPYQIGASHTNKLLANHGAGASSMHVGHDISSATTLGNQSASMATPIVSAGGVSNTSTTNQMQRHVIQKNVERQLHKQSVVHPTMYIPQPHAPTISKKKLENIKKKLLEVLNEESSITDDKNTQQEVDDDNWRSPE